MTFALSSHSCKNLLFVPLEFSLGKGMKLKLFQQLNSCDQVRRTISGICSVLCCFQITFQNSSHWIPTTGLLGKYHHLHTNYSQNPTALGLNKSKYPRYESEE